MKRVLFLVFSTVICFLTAVMAFADSPANDDCTNAIAIGEVTGLEYTTVDATFDGEGECMTAFNIWYVYTPTFTGTAIIDVSTSYENRIAVYNGADCSPISDLIECTSSYHPEIEVVAGQQYLIEIGGNSSTGIGYLTISEGTGGSVNDDCADATDAGTLTEGDTVALTVVVEDATSDCFLLEYPEVWVKFTIEDSQDVTIDFCGNMPMIDSYGIHPYLYDACPCEAGYEIQAGLEDMCSDYNPLFGWYNLPAGTYYFPLMESPFLAGEVDLSISVSASTPAPDNDACENADNGGTLESGVPVEFTGTNAGASNECSELYYPEVWVQFTTASTMDVTIEFCGTDPEFSYSINKLYDSCPCGEATTSSSSGDCEDGNPYKVWSSLPAGTYYYPILTISGSVGEYVVTVTGVDLEPPTNDNCADAIAIGEVTELAYTTEEATLDGEGECMTAFNIWYVYTPTFTGTAIIDVSTSYENQIAVYDGADCSPISDLIECTSSYRPEIDVVAGQQYLIEIGGNGSTGSGYLTISEGVGIPDNNDCEDATDAGTLTEGDTVALTTVVENATSDCDLLEYPEVWVQFTIVDNQDVTIDFCGNSSIVAYNAVHLYLYDACPCESGNEIETGLQGLCSDYNPQLVWYNLPAGTYYYPLLESDDLSGEVDLNISVSAGTPPPDNDDCENATDGDTLTAGVPIEFTGSNVAATMDCSELYFPEVWIQFTTDTTMNVTIEFCGSEPEFVMSTSKLYDSCPCGESVSSNTGGDCDDGNPYRVWNELPAGTYLYPIITIVGSMGDYVVTVSGEESGGGGTGPENDDCMDATDIGFLLEGDSISMTTVVEDATADCELLEYPEVWVLFTIFENQDVTIDFLGNSPILSYNAVVPYLYNDCPCDVAEEFEANLQDFCSDYNPQYTWYNLPAGIYFYPLMESEELSSEVDFNISVSASTPAPDNDDCENATDGGTLEAGVPIEFIDNNVGASNDCPELSYAEVWVEFTTTSTMDVTIEFCGSEPEFVTAVNKLYDSCPCGESVSSNSSGDCDDGNPYRAWSGLPAGTYLYPIMMVVGSMGDYVVTVTGEESGGGDTYEYLPGDANMAAETWPAQTIGGDVTYLVNYFRGLADPCYLDGFYASADATGDCLVVGGDVTYLVNYFRGLADMSYCSDYESAWPTPSDVPAEAPDGWPNCQE